MGLTGKEPVDVKSVQVVPRDLLLTLASKIPPCETEGGVYESQCAVVKGEKDGVQIEYEFQCITYTEEGSPITGFPPSIVGQWLAKGMFKKGGVFPPENIIDPEPFFKELGKRKIEVTVSKKVLMS